MSQMRHILMKDLRRLRWGLIAWFASLLARTLTDTLGADVALEGFGPQIGIGELSGLLSLITVVLLALLVSQLVHDEPLVGGDAFWITRPIMPSALMAAKLTFATVFFVLLPLAGGVIVAATFGATGGDITRTVPVLLLNQSILVLGMMALAALTPSLTRFVAAIVGVVSAFVLLMVSLVFVAVLLTEEITNTSEARLPDPTSGVVAGALMALVALAVIVYQYRRRQLRQAMTIAGIGIFVVTVVAVQWPWSFAAQSMPDSVAAPPQTSGVFVSLDGSRLRVYDETTFRRRALARKHLATHAIVTGVPPEIDVRTIVARSRLELPAGVVLTSGGENSNTRVMALNGSAPGRGSSIEAALGGVRLLTRNDVADRMSSEPWPTVLEVDENDFVRYGNEPGRLTANVDLMLQRPVVRGTMPLADNATANISGLHVNIVRVIRRATGCTVLLRRSYVEGLFSPRRFREVMYLLRNRSRGEAVSGGVNPLSREGFSAGGWQLSAPQVGGRGFVLEQFELQFPVYVQTDGPSVDLDESWLAGSELVVLETVPAGSITRSVTLEGFRMKP